MSKGKSQKTKRTRSKKMKKGPKKSFGGALVRAPDISKFSPYPYKFTMLPCILRADTIVPGLIQFRTTPATQVSQNPLNTASMSTTVSSGTGFADHYDFGMAATFRLTDLQNYPTFSSMYDAYRIRKVDVLIEYLKTSTVQGTPGVQPTLYLYNDQDDASPPTDLRGIVGKEGVRMKLLGNKDKILIKHSIVPRIAPTAKTAGGGLGAMVAEPDQWINCTDGTVNHYALKCYIIDFYAPGSVNVQSCFKFNFVYHVEFRAPLLTL